MLETKATHFPYLLRACLKTSGPMLEFGCGFYSSFLLHSVGLATNRKVVTLDINEGWLNEMASRLRSNMHEFIHLPNWGDHRFLSQSHWGVVFIDHAPAERRRIDIVRAREHAEIIVVHDTEQVLYEYKEALESFQYRRDFTELEPFTTLVSETNDLKDI